jgi:sulfur-oxidizing protein SoxY
MQRRRFIGVVATALTTAWMLPLQAIAKVINQAWNKPAFDADKLNDAVKNLGITGEISSNDIEIIAPDKAENGAVVQIEITSKIANTESISIFVEKNPTALIGSFNFSNGAEPFVITRIKMAEDSAIKIVVSADGKYFSNSKKVIVLENGCG